MLALILAFGVILLLFSEKLHLDHKTLSLIFHLLGAFLVIAVPMEILREWFYEKRHMNSIVKNVGDIFEKKIDQLINTKKFGLDHIEDKLSFEDLFDNLQHGDILWWLDTFCPGEITWVRNFENAIQRGATVNMLIMDPNFPLCEMRAQELGEPFSTEDSGELDFTKQLKRFLKTFCDLQKKYPNRLNIVLYNDLLGVPCYIVERNNQPIYAYSSMYLTQPTGLCFPHFRWNKGEGGDIDMCKILVSYVKEKYDRFAINQQGGSLHGKTIDLTSPNQSQSENFGDC